MHGPRADRTPARVVNRNALPRWVNGAIDRIADAPMSPIGRLAARRMGRPGPRGSVPATSFEDKPIRVLIAPVNYSGQAVGWARALERADPRISARNTAIDVPGGFAFDADLVVPVATFHNDPDWQRREFEAARTATHLLIEAEEPPFGRLMGRSVAKQAAAVAASGVDVAYLGHGTDVRLPSRHIASHPRSYFSDPAIYLPRAEQVARRNIDLVEASGRPIFVSTPDLLADLPTAVWCPVVVDPLRWGVPRIPRGERPLRVVHAPSVGHVKGTELVLPALERLHDDGVIELELVRGVPSEHMPDVFARADVMIDQFRIGSYGVAACEAMAAGCVVVGDVSEAVRRTVADRAGLPLPIVQSDPRGIERVLRDLASSGDLARQQESGREFVTRLHDGRMAAQMLIGHWISPGPDEKEATRAPAG